MKKNQKMTVDKIKNGTVIDHIPAGKALDVVSILKIRDKISTDSVLVTGTNFKSSQMGRKDFVKIGDVTLSPNELQVISLIAPNATVSIIKNEIVEDKNSVVLPDEIKGVITCLNEECVTNHEKDTDTLFFIVNDKSERNFVCYYCERMSSLNELIIKL